jgi:hypothetical protein
MMSPGLVNASQSTQKRKQTHSKHKHKHAPGSGMLVGTKLAVPVPTEQL